MLTRGAVVLLALVAATLFAQGPAGPIRKRPRPTTAPAEKPPPAPRIGQRPVEYSRDPIGYLPPSDPVLLKAIDANQAFDDELPNFLCRQVMQRSRSRNLGKTWKDEDIVEAEVLIVEQVEEYRDITIDGEPTGAKDLSQIGGWWSTGEYGTVMYNLFIPPSQTKFEEAGPDTIGDRRTLVYDYEIEQENSRWTLRVNNREYSPGHGGKVWLDLETARAIRIETAATYLPHDYPLNRAAIVLEYGDVEIDGESYLLPVLAENLGCIRDTARCQKTRIEFRDYRKFSSESTLFTTDSDIDFGETLPEPQ